MLNRALLCLLVVALTLITLVSCDVSSSGDTETDAKLNATDTAQAETVVTDEDEAHILTNYDNMKLRVTYGEDEYYTVRKTLWTEDFDMGQRFEYLGEIGEEIDGITLEGVLVPQDGTIYVTEENSFVPVDTPVYMTEDGDFVRVAFWGVSYYLRLREETEYVDPMDMPDGMRAPFMCYNGEIYAHTLVFGGGGLWEFKLDEDWSFVGFIRSEILVNDIMPEFNLEADFHLGKPVYYNEKLDRIAILVEDDNYAYSDVDWEILERIPTKLPND